MLYLGCSASLSTLNDISVNFGRHTQIDGIMTPMIYALLPGKSPTIYTRFFTLLQEHMTNFNIPFHPTTAFVDFEIATHNAIRSVFPGIDVKEWFFSTSLSAYGERLSQQDFRYCTATM